ncbi:MAG: hypothetical protein EPN72_09305 [Nevskiaceae bacterium]|nr:MAG: hypothetical protein EPN63_08645 [Nevskiaceae bacterium]TBR72631.1 MAG: hypothetical protein EPN72_09305 [Nevskiaceae bacterium]
MTHPTAVPSHQGLAFEAARIICREALVDYRAAKLKAAQRLGGSLRTAALPDNLSIRDAVVEYQRLFGGARYRERLAAMRHAALQAMRLLASYDPRLVGALPSGAVTDSHRVQLQAFAETAEMVDIFLEDRGIRCRQGDRDYRFAGGDTRIIPLTQFEVGNIGVDVATFDPDRRAHPPLSPVTGKAERGLDLTAVEALGDR